MKFHELLKAKKHSLVISLPANDAKLAEVSWAQGVDAVKVHINVAHKASGTAFGSFEQEKNVLKQILAEAKGPCGIVPGVGVDVVAGDYKNAIDAGFNFTSLYAHDMPISLANESSISKMVAFDGSYEIDDLKYLERCKADVFEASIVQSETYGQALSFRELVRYARICESTNLPVLVPTQRKILSSEVGNLISCGVRATMIGAIVTGSAEESIKRAVAEYRNAIDKLI